MITSLMHYVPIGMIIIVGVYSQSPCVTYNGTKLTHNSTFQNSTGFYKCHNGILNSYCVGSTPDGVQHVLLSESYTTKAGTVVYYCLRGDGIASLNFRPAYCFIEHVREWVAYGKSKKIRATPNLGRLYVCKKNGVKQTRCVYYESQTNDNAVQYIRLNTSQILTLDQGKQRKGRGLKHRKETVRCSAHGTPELISQA